MGQPGEQARIREVLIALGGSAEDFDRAHERPATEGSLESRIEAYSRIIRLRETAPAGTSGAAAPVARRRPGLALARALRTIVQAPIFLLRLLASLVTRAASAIRASALLLVGAIVAAARSVGRAARAIAHTIQSCARFVLRTVALVLRAFGAIVLAVTGAPRAAARSLRPRPRRRRDGPDDFSVAIVERVRAATGPPPPPAPVEPKTFEREPSPAAAPPAAPVAELPAQPRARQRKRRRTPVLAVLAAAIAAAFGATFVVVHGHGGGAPQANGQQAAPSRSLPHVAPAPVPSRAAYTDPRAYAAAMTRLALTTGQTELNGTPACGEDSTWNRWTCEAKGRPTVGAYAGHWLTYRCAPAYHPQPGGRPASLMINCKPVAPPALTA